MRTNTSNNIALELPSSRPSTYTDPSPGTLPALSPRLHNKDLAPTRIEGRRWGRYSIFALWTNDVHNIANYSFAIGLYDRCASVRASGLAVLELEQDPQRAVQAIVRQAELAVSDDKAEVICLGCGGMAGLDEQIRQRTGVPVVDGVTAAVTIAESLVRLRLSTSKVRTYATPRPKTLVGWPLRFGR